LLSLHSSPASQPWPQSPQLSSSVVVSTQKLLQQVPAQVSATQAKASIGAAASGGGSAASKRLIGAASAGLLGLSSPQAATDSASRAKADAAKANEARR
jgi:hypothetical protein